MYPLVEVYKVKYHGLAKCSGVDCAKSPEHLTEDGFFKIGTIKARISCGGFVDLFYCKGCIPKLYKYIKEQLDPNLWVFK
jgi:hypothetical protein